MKLLANLVAFLTLWNGVATSAEISPQSLLLHLPLTNDLKDFSPQHHEEDTEGTVEVRDGGARFAGDGNWIEAPHLDLKARPFALALWIKPAGNSNYGLIEQGAASAPNQFLHAMLRGRLQPYFGFLGNDLMSPVSIPTNQWTHLIFQFDGTRQQIWVNGDLLCERRAPAYAGNTGLTRIGHSPRWNTVPSHDFEGAMRDVRIYGRALSFDEIVRLSGSSKVQPGSEAPMPVLSLSGNTLTVRGTIGEVYEVEASANLDGGWQKLATLTNTVGRVQCLDPKATLPGERYYRITTR